MSIPEEKQSLGDDAIPRMATDEFLLRGVAGWNNDKLADCLCDLLGIPNLNRRSGLAQVHGQLNDIIMVLSRIFEMGYEDDRVVRAIVACYAKLSVDAVLAVEMIKKEIPFKLRLLLDERRCLSLALQAYASLESHGLRTRQLGGNTVTLLLNIMQEYPSDAHIIDHCIYILMKNCTVIARNSNLGQQRSQLQELLIQHLKTATAPFYRLEATFEIFSRFCLCRTPDSTDQSLESQSFMTFLLATMCSRDITKRWLAFRSIFQWRGSDTTLDWKVMDAEEFLIFMTGVVENLIPPPFDKLYDTLRRFPNCELNLSIETWQTRRWALKQIVQYGNYYVVGVKLADLIVRGGRLHEFSDKELPEYQLMRLDDSKTPEPLKDFLEILPRCAIVVWTKSKDAKHREMRDILLTYWLWNAPGIREGILDEHLPKVIEEYPSQPFFYVVLAHHVVLDNQACLRAAKKGLEVCDKLKTPMFVMNSLRYMAGESAWWLGFGILMNALHDFNYVDEEQRNRSWGEGVAFLTSALMDFQMVIASWSPDSRYLRQALIWYVMLLYILEGEIGEEIKTLKEKWRHTQFVFIPHELDPLTTRGMRTVFELFLDRMTDAKTEWSNVISRWDDLSEASSGYPNLTIRKKFVKSCVKKWLKAGEGDKESGSISFKYSATPPESQQEKIHIRYHDRDLLQLNTADIPRCYNCLLPIALMKKCAGCRKIKYCAGNHRQH